MYEQQIEITPENVTIGSVSGVEDVKVNNVSVVTDNVANIDNATTTTAGVMSSSDKSKLDGIEAGAEVNDITDVQLNGTTVVSNHIANIQTIDNVTSTSTNPLSANQGKLLNDRINNLETIGRFLALWNCATGLPLTNPTTLPYTYRTGDYFRISTISQYIHTITMSGTDNEGEAYNVSFVIRNNISGAYSTVNAIASALQYAGHTGHSGTCPATGTAGSVTVAYVAEDNNYVLLQDSSTSLCGTITNDTQATISDTVTGSATNYMPNGSQYTGVASSTVTTDEVHIGDIWFYDGTNWNLQVNVTPDSVQDVKINNLSVVSDGIAYITNATTSTAGTMSAADKTKVDIITTTGSGDTFLADDGTYKTAGGGGSYTAGTNMSIGSNNTINCTIPYSGVSSQYVGIGENTLCSNRNVAIGYHAFAQGQDSVVVGAENTTGRYANYSVAIGFGIDQSANSVAVGYYTDAGQYSVTIGASAGSVSQYCVAVGRSSKCNYNNSIAIGAGAITTKQYQMMIGGVISDYSIDSHISEIAVKVDSSGTVKTVMFNEDLESKLKEIDGYDASKTLTLKCTSGYLHWDEN